MSTARGHRRCCRWRRPCRRRLDDRGTAPGELVVLASLTFLFVGAIVFAGRINISAIHVEGAARAAARSLSLARDPDDIVDEAREEAEEAVGLGGPLCRSLSFDHQVHTSRETGLRYVTVEISCEVDLAQASLVRVPGSMTVSSSATEVVDRYREQPAVGVIESPGEPDVPPGGDPGEIGPNGDDVVREEDR
jgi:hypothetical protein